MTDDKETPVSSVEPIEAYLAGADLDADVRSSVQQLSEAGGPDTAALLRRVAELSSTTGNRRVTFDALDGLDKVGDQRSYLLDAARGHAQNKWLAYHAIIVLGRDATYADVWDALSALRSEISDAELLGALALAERVRYLEEQYSSRPEPADRLRFVLDTFRTEWNPITQAGGEIDRGTDPQAVWSQRKLRELSAENPEGTADAVAQAYRVSVSGPSAWRYRRFLAQFLGPDAQERFRAVDPGEG
jgi:hypothetical protein